MAFHHQCTGTENIAGFDQFITLLAVFIGPVQSDSALEHTEHGRTRIVSLEDHVTGMDAVHLTLLSEGTHGVESIHGEIISETTGRSGSCQ